MKRKDRQITDEEGIKEVIMSSRVCRLGMIDGSRPYIVPLCFGYRDNVLYFHGAKQGKKIDLILQNPNVCFEFDRLFEIVEAKDPCKWSMHYESVIGFGKAALVEDIPQKREAMNIIMEQYSGELFKFSEKMIRATAVIRVDIESMTGKRSSAPPNSRT